HTGYIWRLVWQFPSWAKFLRPTGEFPLFACTQHQLLHYPHLFKHLTTNGRPSKSNRQTRKGRQTCCSPNLQCQSLAQHVTKKRATPANVHAKNRPNTRSSKASGPTVGAQESAPGSPIDGSPLMTAPDDIRDAVVDSQRTTGEEMCLDNEGKTTDASPKQAPPSVDGIAEGSMPSAAKDRLVAEVDFILDQEEIENVDDEQAFNEEADPEREDEYEDESSEEEEPGESERGLTMGGVKAQVNPAIILEYQVAAADRLRNTGISSAFTYNEHRHAIAGAMGSVDPKDVNGLELAWKLSTAKKNKLPAEFSGAKDLTKVINSYQAALEKERKKKADLEKKVKDGKAAGKKAPLPQDIVIMVSRVGDGPKKGKGKTNDDDKEASTAADTKTDVTFSKSACAKFPCAKDPMAVGFLDPFGNHHHVTPTDVNLWETLSKQNPDKYSVNEIPQEIREAPNQSGTAPNTASASASAPTLSNNFHQGIMFPRSAFPFLSYFNGIDPSLMATYPPTPFGYNPFICPPGHGYDGVGIYGAPPSPAHPEVALNYPWVITWFESHVDTNPERVSDGESYAHFGPILERVGFRWINQLVSNKDVRVTAETLKGLDIKVGFGTNIL
ncbi:hypothetical protein M407DRAFT_13193, partial [Tulasnella calospora MUT 4182]